MTAYRLRSALVPLVLGLALGVSGCRTDVISPDGDDSQPATLVVSETWLASQGSGGTGGDAAAGASAAQARIIALQEAIDELRAETGTGWTGRQDDVTGYLAELSGGSWPGAPDEFMDAYGTELFGVDSTVVRLGDPDSDTVPGHTSVRGTQAVGEVPVLDSNLVFISRDTAGTLAGRLASVRGRVFPGLSLSTDPELGPRAARRRAEAASGGTADGEPALVVVPSDAGILTWEVTIVAEPPADGTGDQPLGAGSGTYYVDARTGDVVTVRPITGAGRAAEPDPNSVEVVGVDLAGTTLTAHGRRTASGVELVDTTTRAWEQASGRGGVYTYDATGINSFSGLPGRLVVSPDTTVRDPEAIAMQRHAREVIDYYEELGRSSWDDAGAPLINSVNFGPSDFCNGMFIWGGAHPQLIMGNPCVLDGEELQGSIVEIDYIGHEVTHGVTATSAGLIYSGQSGALNESFSDYFGNVIGNRVEGTEDDGWSENSCTGITGDTLICATNPDGTKSVRYLLNGFTFDDYLRVLNVGRRIARIGYDQDNGGVHTNSGIWNNALWSIRSQLAKIDNLPGNQSPLAQSFDRVVYGALTTRLGATAGFLDARAAVEQVIIDSGLDPVVLRVAREVFDANKICAGCTTTAQTHGDAVAATAHGEILPGVSGDRVAWLDLTVPQNNVLGRSAVAAIGGAAPVVGAASDVLEVVFAGDALLTATNQGQLVRTDPSGAEQVVGELDDRLLAAGVAGSDAGAAWLTAGGRGEELSFLAPAGALTRASLPGLAGDAVTGIGTGGGWVAAGTAAGKVFAWQPGSAPTQVGTMPDRVLTLAAYDGNVLAIDAGFRAHLFTKDGRTMVVSKSAAPFGAAMSADYAVWTEAKEIIATGAGAGIGYVETDLHLVSLGSGKIYSPVPAPGQQGFPALSGRRLVWQDAVLGGDDVFTTELPPGW
jgi:hypothetical protein